MARAAGDLDLLLSVLAGPIPEDAIAWQVELPEPRVASLAGLRVATWFDDDACPVDAECRSLLRGATDALADAGARVEDAHPPVDFGKMMNLYMRLIAAAVSPSMPDDVGDQISGSHLAWLRADERRAAVQRTWAEWFHAYDVLLLPAWATPPFEHDQVGNMLDRVVMVNGQPRNHFEISHWLMIVNVTDHPALTVPIGRRAAALPVGMQVVAPYLQDRRAIRVAEPAAEVLGAYEVPPSFE